MTDDNMVARGEDQMAGERADMAPKGGKGPTAASAADTEGAFGDREKGTAGASSTSDSLSEGPMVFDNVGPRDS